MNSLQPLLYFCDILQTEMDIPTGKIYLWDQKIFQPTGSGLYVAVSVPRVRPFGNVNEKSADGLKSDQFVTLSALVDIDIMSRGPEARDRKEEVILALESQYARQQQDAYSFYIGKLSTSFLNLSNVDGAAIPYRYRISVALQYTVTLEAFIQYYSSYTFQIVNVSTEDFSLWTESGIDINTQSGEGLEYSNGNHPSSPIYIQRTA